MNCYCYWFITLDELDIYQALIIASKRFEYFILARLSILFWWPLFKT